MEVARQQAAAVAAQEQAAREVAQREREAAQVRVGLFRTAQSRV